MYFMFRILNKYMKKNILITWTSKWIWKYLTSNLKNDFNVYCISRNSTDIEGIFDINIDLTNFSEIDDFVKNCEEKNIFFDSLILNAWVWYFWKFEDASDQEYLNIINLNLSSNILFVKKVLHLLNEKSKIIFLWSIISKKFMKFWAVYQASKFWIRWFAWALKNELKWKSVHILNPKIVDTWFHDKSNIELNFSKNQLTPKKNILDTIINLLEWNDKRFEIDL